MNEAIAMREGSAHRLKKDVTEIFNTLKKIGLYEFNSKSKYKWRHIDNGYGGWDGIFVGKRFGFREALVHDIERMDCFIRLIEGEDRRIFDAIEEATMWIKQKTELIKQKTEKFNSEYWEKKREIKVVIDAYNSLEE